MKNDIDNELNELSPFLADLKKGMEKDKEPFRVPKFYFDTLADKVIEKAQPQVVPPQYSTQPSIGERVQAWLGLLFQPRYAMALGTVIILAVGGIWFYNSHKISETSLASVQLSEISNDEIHEYIHANIDDFEDQIIEKNETLADNTEGTETINVSEEEINEYLKENIDENDLKALENDL